MLVKKKALSKIVKSPKTEVDLMYSGRLFQVLGTKYLQECKPYVVVGTLGILNLFVPVSPELWISNFLTPNKN